MINILSARKCHFEENKNIENKIELRDQMSWTGFVKSKTIARNVYQNMSLSALLHLEEDIRKDYEIPFHSDFTWKSILHEWLKITSKNWWN
jgi:hypothetical protein